MLLLGGLAVESTVHSMKTFRAWNILKKFKESCKMLGWRTSETDDWIEINNEYHSFLLTRNVHPASFKNIVYSKKCVVREGLSYRVVEAKYTAWVFSEAPSRDLIDLVLEDLELSKRVAIYDLSPLMEGRKLCIKFNKTESRVFQEFENYLRKELDVKLKACIKKPYSGRYRIMESAA
ncbi:MAG: hypothetical protein QXE16_03880 [Candidatus Bathyarchaeia archaeon]